MTVEHDPDNEETVEMVRPVPVQNQSEEFDPEKTLVRENWETTVIKRIASHVEAVQSEVADHPDAEGRYGWESEGLRRLSRELQRKGR